MTVSKFFRAPNSAAVGIGASIGAVKGALDYNNSDDKSIGSLVGKLGANAAGGAALGAAASYGAMGLSKLKKPKSVQSEQKMLASNDYNIPKGTKQYDSKNPNPRNIIEESRLEYINSKGVKKKVQQPFFTTRGDGSLSGQQRLKRVTDSKGNPVKRRTDQNIAEASKNTSPFANFHQRSFYKGFWY